MIPFLNQPWSWAPVAPIACAIHCAAAPAFVAFAPSVALASPVEAWLLAFTATVSALSVARGVVGHRQWRVAIPVGVGLACWGASLGGVFAPLPEDATTAAAALVVAGGLLWSQREGRRKHEREGSTTCSCSHCERSGTAPAEAEDGARGVA